MLLGLLLSWLFRNQAVIIVTLKSQHLGGKGRRLSLSHTGWVQDQPRWHETPFQNTTKIFLKYIFPWPTVGKKNGSYSLNINSHCDSLLSLRGRTSLKPCCWHWVPMLLCLHLSFSVWLGKTELLQTSLLAWFPRLASVTEGNGLDMVE